MVSGPPSPDAPWDLILASASPRRRDLLQQVGLRLRIEAVDVDETAREGESATELPRRLAAAKAEAAAARASGDTSMAGLPVLAADTVVIVDRVALGKPADADQATAMLQRLAGRRHEVVTSYCIRRAPATTVERSVSTLVSFRLLEPAEIAAYLASGEWRDKAGGYAVQGIAAAFVTDLRGSHTNVIGLPVPEVVADLRAAGCLTGWPPRAFGQTTPDAG